MCEKLTDYYNNSFLYTKKWGQYVAGGMVIAIIVLLLEICVFNFRHFQFSGNKAPVIVDNWTMSEGLSFADYNAFQVTSLESRPYIEITDLDMPLNLLYFDFVNVEQGDFGVLDFKYQIELTDEGNALPYQIPSRYFFRLVDKTHYTTINPYGNVHSVRVYFDNLNEGDIIRVCSFIMNPGYSWQISKKRMMALFVFIYILWVIRPGSSLYTISMFEDGDRAENLLGQSSGKSKVSKKSKPADDKSVWAKRAVVLVVLLLEILVFYKVSHLNKYFNNIEPGGQTQFMQLTEAIVDRGEVFLNAIPPEGLSDMKDPYDATLRNATVGPYSNIGDMSDTGYYQGRYFVYFGIAPILLFYVPFYAITGTHIATRTVFFIISIANCIGVLFLLYELCRRYFRKLPFVIYLMFSALFTFGAGQMFLALSPDFYAVPIMFALSSIELGLGFWIHALNLRDDSVQKNVSMSADENGVTVVAADNNAKQVSLPWYFLAIGSLFMALPAASRPQFLIASFLAFVIFWKSVFTDRTLLSKKSIGQTVAFALPYAFVAAGVMYYNFIRFGNVFDFGANYNFCYNNMPYRGWHIDRLLHPLVGYLFYPCTVTNQFPYFELSSYSSRYMGITADETLFGGVMYNNIYLIVALLAFRFKKAISEKAAYLLAVIGPVFAIIVGVVDANMAGTLPRYYADFTWGYMISAFIVIGYLYTSGKASVYGKVTGSDASLSSDVVADRVARRQAAIRVFLYVSFIWTVIRLFLMPFAGVQLFNNNKMVYYTVKSLVEFWY